MEHSEQQNPYARALKREKQARKQAEHLLEAKSRELFLANQRLQEMNLELEQRVQARTEELKVARDEAMASNEAKTRFLANMSHEFRTPLNAILGMTELLQIELSESAVAHSSLAQETQDKLLTIENAAQSLFSLLTSVLDATKMEVGELVLEESVFPCSELCADIQRVWQRRFAEKSLGFDMSFNASGLQGCDPNFVFLSADLPRIQQLLHHLLSNAHKFTNKGRVRLTMDARLLEETVTSSSPGYVELGIAVLDTGIGMDEDAKRKACLLFSQYDASTTRKYGGCGVGLALVSSIASRYQGSVHIESQVDQGSCVSVRLRLPLSRPLNTAKEVIVLDTSQAHAWLLKQLLNAWGMGVRVCKNVEEFEKHGQRAGRGLAILDAYFAPDALQKACFSRMIGAAVMSLDPPSAQLSHLCAEKAVCLLEKPIQAAELAKWLASSSLPAPALSRPPADFSEAIEGMGDDAALFAVMVERFLQSSPELVEQLESAAEKQDFEQLRFAAHKLKGSIGILQQGPAFRSITRIEEEAQAQAVDESLLTGFHQDFFTLKRDLKDYLDRSL